MTDTPRPSNHTVEEKLALEILKGGPIHHLPIEIGGPPAWLGFALLLLAFALGMLVGWLI